MGRAPHHGMTRNGGAGDPLAERVGESGRVPPNVRGRRSRHATRHYSPSTSTSRSRQARRPCRRGKRMGGPVAGASCTLPAVATRHPRARARGARGGGGQG
jgi:hypothetical protein